MTEADLLLAVRATTSSKSNMDELLDDDIKRHYDWILKRIGTKISIRNLRYITSVANQRDYSVPNEVLRVIRLFKWDSSYSNYMTTNNLGGSHRPDSYNGNEYYNFPSMWVIKMMKKVRGLPRVSWEFNPIDRLLSIDPYPTEAGTKYYYVSAEKSKWTLSGLPEDMEELVVIGSTWKAVEQIAMARSSLGGVVREGGFVTYPATELWNLSKELKTDFYEELDTKAMLLSRY